MKSVLVLFLSVWGCINCLSAQELIGAAGDVYINGNLQVSWSLGEIITETYIGESHVLTNGFQQSEILINLVNNDSELSFVVYPNPVKNTVYLKQWDNSFYQYQIYDSSGKLIVDESSREQIMTVNLSEYKNAMYYLIISKEGKNKIYKIIKN
ncbi:MAG: T9SS type A sorting domain-containing protein [Bacteroidales bacterium]|nr:T9SS type A sorting domain-containing protein [Bacteroidales bacterium]